MLAYLRYALAAVCFAASVGCLALWWRSVNRWEIHEWLTHPALRGQIFQTIDGMAAVQFNYEYRYAAIEEKTYFYTSVRQTSPYGKNYKHLEVDKHGLFRLGKSKVHFPLWYPALIFALAGVGVLRFRRQFSIRSTLVVMSAVAALLGMAVVL